MTTHLKMDEAWALCKVNATFYLQNAYNMDKGRLLLPLSNHTILAHQPKKLSIC
jgi:hypothetical protein